MAYETVIAAFGDAAHANGAVRALRQIGVPGRDIRRHPVDPEGIEELAAAPAAHPAREFWSWLFDRNAVEKQIALYEQALSRGGTVISVRVMAEEAAKVRETLEAHGAIDLEETRPGC